MNPMQSGGASRNGFDEITESSLEGLHLRPVSEGLARKATVNPPRATAALETRRRPGSCAGAAMHPTAAVSHGGTLAGGLPSSLRTTARSIPQIAGSIAVS